MSYCRFSTHHDVYCWSDGDKYTILMAWDMSGPRAQEEYTFGTAKETLEMLYQLRREGVAFDQDAIFRLRREIEE